LDCEYRKDAPLYTLIHKPGSVPESIENRIIKTSFLNSLPGIHKHYRKFLPLFPKAADSLRISEEADLILSSSHCVIKGVKKPEGSKHLSYIHSPMRYIYDQFDVYFGSHAPLYQRMGAKACRGYLTGWDLKSNDNVDTFVANARFVEERIKKYYQKDSLVIHPFVELDEFVEKRESAPPKDNFFLMVSAFAPNKRVDLAVKAFNKLGLTLKIIGSGQQENSLREIAKDNVQFLGNLSRQEVMDHFLRARAFIFPGVEDFGITPLESLASGTPVIAFKKGGVLETLNEDVAHFFENPDEESLYNAVLEFQKKESSFLKEKLYARANDFSKDFFKSNIKNAIEQTLS